MKTLNEDFINKTLHKIEIVINRVLQAHNVEMTYDLSKRNEVFCEVIRRTATQLVTTEMFETIQNALFTQTALSAEQSDWLSEQIYQFNKDIFLLHYFYAIIYSYNYDSEIREKVTEDNIQDFFNKANSIYKNIKKQI